MKKKLRVLFSILLAFVFAFPLLTGFGYGTTDNIQPGTESGSQFTYPISSGTEKWAQLNHGERVLALQIPESILKDMKTEELVKIVLDYPCFFDMIFYNSYQEGFEVVAEHFNGLQELLSREDAGKYLLDVYRDFSVEKALRIRNEQERFEIFLGYLYLESVLSQPEISDNMTEEELDELLSLVDERYDLLLHNADTSSALSLSAYYENLAEQQGVVVTPNAYTTVPTPNGTNVAVIIVTDADAAYADRANIKKIIERDFIGATVVGDATNRYNCHAYAWASRTDVWMNNPSPYWTDGSYTIKSYNSPTATGQKVYYSGNGNEHSGNVVRLSGNIIRSKWGEGSLVEHSAGNCPYFFIPLQVVFYGR